MPTAACPQCSEEVFVDVEMEQGDTVSCEECGDTLVVVGLDPIELDLADGEDGEFDDDDDNYNDDYEY